MVVIAVATIVSSAHASERRFTFVYEATTQPKGTLEFEQWVTWKTEKESDRNFGRFDFRHELELGLTDNLQLALYVSDWRYERGDSVDDGAEWRDAAIEIIYNLWDPVTEPLGLALYGEIKVGDALLELEGKLIVQKNVGKWVLAWNGTIEAEWEGQRFDEDNGKFEQVLGASYQFTPRLFAGFEVLHEVEYEDWSQWSDHAVYVGPNFSYRTERWWVTITPLLQVTDLDDEPDIQTRLIFGFDF